MSISLPISHTNKSFTFTLFIDDVVDFAEDSFEDLEHDYLNQIGNDIFYEKQNEYEKLTQVFASDDSNFNSPIKNSREQAKSLMKSNLITNFENPGKRNREKKRVKSFLSTCIGPSDDEQASDNCRLSPLTTSLKFNSLGIDYHHKQSIFSHEARIENLNKKEKNVDLVTENKNKITGKILKNSLKNKHFERVIKKLNRFIENCRVQNNA